MNKNQTYRWHSDWLMVIIMAVSLSGCGSGLLRKRAVPENQHTRAQAAVSPGLRYVISSPEGVSAMMAELQENQQHIKSSDLTGTGNYLLISGGGDKGAFGAGLLSGWTVRGDRPEFNLVTGVSTGALIAPFAFLGSKYDNVLKYVYTQVTPQMIYKNRGLMAAVFEDSLGDSTPLYHLISEYINADFLKEVANEYQRGRWLLVATTNIDAGVPVVWNMGKIASIGTPDSLELFRRVLLASASVPGHFRRLCLM